MSDDVAAVKPKREKKEMTPEQRAEYNRKMKEYMREWRKRKKSGFIGIAYG